MQRNCREKKKSIPPGCIQMKKKEETITALCNTSHALTLTNHSSANQFAGCLDILKLDLSDLCHTVCLISSFPYRKKVMWLYEKHVNVPWNCMWHRANNTMKNESCEKSTSEKCPLMPYTWNPDVKMNESYVKKKKKKINKSHYKVNCKNKL